MNTNSIVKYFFITLILVLLLLGLIYVFYSNISKEKPYEILTPDVYEEGTTVNLYTNVPPGFPTEVISEERYLDYSGSVVNPDGRTQITVSYVSDKTIEEVVDIYSQSLPQKGWQIITKSVYPLVTTIQATNSERNITLSIASGLESGVIVTFQYEE